MAANLALSSTAASFLGVRFSSFTTAQVNAVNYFGQRFDAAMDDINSGYGDPQTYTNSLLVAYLYSYGANVRITGSGLTGNSPLVTSVTYSDSDGRFSFAGNWIANSGITGVQLTRLESWEGNTGFSYVGSMRVSMNGDVTGSLTSYKVVAQGVTIELSGSMPLSGIGGTLSSIAISDANNSITLSGSYSYEYFSSLTEGTAVIGDLFNDATYLTGNDTLRVGSTNREWHGYGGNDTIFGGNGNDRLYGDEGNDSLNGSNGTDTLYGGAGDDLLIATVGGDTLIGGAGDDRYSLDGHAAVIVEEAGGGNDSISVSNYDAAAPQVTVDLSDYTNIERISAEGTASFLLVGDEQDNRLQAGSANDTLMGGGGNDTLHGGSGVDTLIGGEGDDMYIMYYDATMVDIIVENADEGSDTVLVTASYTLAANIENAELLGNANATLTGDAGANTLRGNYGANTIDGGAGGDAMFGGGGNDVFIVDDEADSAEDSLGGGIDTVRASASHVMGEHVENLFMTGAAHIDATGNALINTLTGNAGNNTLAGGGGADVLTGGFGDDTYVVNLLASGTRAVKIEDKITEAANAGNDTLALTSATLALTAPVTLMPLTNIENIDVSGTGMTMLHLKGNTAVNTLTGNAAANTLDGLTGADRMIGAAGDDVYIIDNTGDVAVEAANEGSDTLNIAIKNAATTAVVIRLADFAHIENATVTGTGKFDLVGDAADNRLVGNTVVNVLTGGEGNDTLNGGGGADTMIGGIGDDVYYIDNTGDVVQEMAGQGIDTVWSSTTYRLIGNIENAGLTGTAVAHLTGDAGVNTLTGNTGGNTLDGGAGADRLIGGKGNDTYVVDDAGDVVVEQAAEGTDTVRAAASYVLGAQLENLVLTGTDHIDATGNELKNTLTGNAGDNTLDGGAGADMLAGGLGNDSYVVNLLSTRATLITLEDKVTEGANAGSDTLYLVSGTLAVTSAATVTLVANVENLDASATGATGLTLKGNLLANSITGSAGNNTIDGLAGNDTLSGGGGVDMLIGGLGADTFVFDAATAFDGIDVIKDFNRAQGDKIDISDVLGTYDALTDDIADFVSVVASGAHASVLVDRDGSGNEYGFEQIATLQGGAAVADLELLITNGSLAVA